MPFTNSEWCFPKETVSFLNALKANNNREWFTEYKAAYEADVKKPAEFFCMLMSEKLHDMTGRTYTPKIFRVYRDVRFSKDKTPYNAHLHISFAPEGDTFPAWFFGLEPERLVLGAGTFGFEGNKLDTYRKRVLGCDGDALADIIGTLETTLNFRISEPDLKRVPRQFDTDHPHAHLLRRKGLVGWYDFPDTRATTTGDTVAACAAVFNQLDPLFNWLMDA